jgi:hypothetical protein
LFHPAEPSESRIERNWPQMNTDEHGAWGEPLG